ncbi:MAG: DNA-binding protein [Anaerolineae bacterium]|nr:DNA-binding protein [Anaerolineae bacterium]
MSHRLHTRTWVLLLVAALWLGLAGCNLGAPAPVITPEQTAVPTAASTGPGYQLFVEPEDSRAPVLSAIADAQHTLRIVMYLITDPDIIQALKDAASQGVDVRLMLELNPYGGSSQNVLVANDLKAAGVSIRWDPRTIHYLHQKTIIVDDAYALVMTGNLTTSAFTANREYIVRTDDPRDVAEIAATFEADWARQRAQHADPRLLWAPDNAREGLLRLIDGAQTTLDIEHQNMQDEEVVDHLVAAARRGVRIRHITSPHYPLDKDADEPGRERLHRAGAQIRYWDDLYVHAKAIIIDGKRALVGSINLTANSLDFNRELSILFDDPAAVARLEKQFEADWNAGREEAFPKTGTPEAGYIDHSQAARFLYQEVTVELPVKAVYNSGRVIWLMPNEDRDRNFKVVIFPSVWDKWPESPDRYYAGKTIRVTGLVKKYRGWPEIIVNDPRQIKVVGQ